MRYHGTRPLMRRMQAIDQALRARRWPTDKSLARDLEVDPRTIHRDLEFMRGEHHAPIAFDRSRGRGNCTRVPGSTSSFRTMP
jgi:predicted DNA-binding transcriptional regulator YafY